MRSLKRCSRCYWSAVDCDGRATVVQVGWRRCCLKDCWECCSSLRLARWGVRFSEARWSQRVDPAGSHISLRRPAPIAGYIATYIMCRANTRTALLEMYVLTSPRHLVVWLDWTELRRLLNCLEADPSENTSRNNTSCVCWLLWKSYLSGCYLDTDLPGHRYSQYVGGFNERLPNCVGVKSVTYHAVSQLSSKDSRGKGIFLPLG
jgi:hypothetical protein